MPIRYNNAENKILLGEPGETVFVSSTDSRLNFSGNHLLVNSTETGDIGKFILTISRGTEPNAILQYDDDDDGVLKFGYAEDTLYPVVTSEEALDDNQGVKWNGDRLETTPSSGDTFPDTPYFGQQFYHTDDNELYYWDGDRNKWLSVAAYTYHFGKAGTIEGSEAMLSNEVGGNANSGVARLFANMTLTNIAVYGRSGVSSSICEVVVSSDGGSETILTQGFVISSATGWAYRNANYNIDTDASTGFSGIRVFVSSEQDIIDPSVVLIFHRKGSS